MRVGYAVIRGLLGRVADCFTQYQPHCALPQRFELATQVEGLDGFELGYRSGFEDPEVVELLLKEYGFGVWSVNLNAKGDPKWRYGSLTAKGPAIHGMRCAT